MRGVLRRFWIVSGCAACGAAAMLSACGKSEPPAPGDAARGAAIYAQYCLPCHQADGSGMPPGGGRPLAASFTDPKGPLTKSDADLLQAIQFGKVGTIGSMPPWRGALTAQQQRDALAYVRSQFGGAR